MNISTQYPWPVLNDSDSFIAGSYVPNLELNESSERFHLQVSHKINSSLITKSIASGKACYVVEVACVATHYRETFLSEESVQEFSIPSHFLRGIVSVSYYVIAKVNITGYISSDFHPDYRNKPFNLAAGSVLAVSKDISKFDAKKRYAGSLSFSSYLTFLALPERQGEMYVDMGEEKIVVKLPAPDHLRVQGLLMTKVKDIEALVEGAYAFPALILALQEAFQNPLSNERKFWYQCLKRSAKEKDIEWEQSNILPIAQSVLRLPATRASEALARIVSPSDVDDETI